jgi:hypothetical protein
MILGPYTCACSATRYANMCQFASGNKLHAFFPFAADFSLDLEAAARRACDTQYGIGLRYRLASKHCLGHLQPPATVLVSYLFHEASV